MYVATAMHNGLADLVLDSVASPPVVHHQVAAREVATETDIQRHRTRIEVRVEFALPLHIVVNNEGVRYRVQLVDVWEILLDEWLDEPSLQRGSFSKQFATQNGSVLVHRVRTVF